MRKQKQQNGVPPEEKITVLEGLAEDRNKWRKLVKDIVAVIR